MQLEYEYLIYKFGKELFVNLPCIFKTETFNCTLPHYYSLEISQKLYNIVLTVKKQYSLGDYGSSAYIDTLEFTTGDTEVTYEIIERIGETIKFQVKIHMEYPMAERLVLELNNMNKLETYCLNGDCDCYGCTIQKMRKITKE